MSNKHKDFRTTMARVITDRINQTKRTVIIEFTRNAQVKSQTTKKTFISYTYSPETVKIRKGEAKMLNLQFKVNLPHPPPHP